LRIKSLEVSVKLKKMIKIIDLDASQARSFFLKEESYFNFDLPNYFAFQGLLDKLSKELSNKKITDLYAEAEVDGKIKSLKANDFANVNHRILNNKDGKFAWRPFQLIHPALYVTLVHLMTDEENWKFITQRFLDFSADTKVVCCSIPLRSGNKQSDKAANIKNWWHKIEQQSLELSISYQYVLHTDITDCYGSIYTHAISWALNPDGKTGAKSTKSAKNIGNDIDTHLRAMSYGQTNGIPQGSVVMDFISEMVLGYADLTLSRRLKDVGLIDFQIIRYRDDYRVFANNPQDAELVTKFLTEILIELGMRLNASKTLISGNVVRDSIKADKLYWLSAKRTARSIQGHLLIIHELAEKYPNSGSLQKALLRYYNRIKEISESKLSISILVGILVDIMFKNPRIYPISTAILSKLLSLEPDSAARIRLLNAIEKRFSKIPNTGHIKIWLQRLTIKLSPEKEYDEELCLKVLDDKKKIWNSEWLRPKIRQIVEHTAIIDSALIDSIDSVITLEKVELFKTDYDIETVDF